KSPQDRAAEMVANTLMGEVRIRKKLFREGKKAAEGKKAVDSFQEIFNDPMIEVARMVDEDARAVRKIFESQVEEVERQAHAQIAKAKYAVEGASTYPDATFTLRLSYGVVKGYEENGKHIPFETTFEGLYQRSEEHNNKEPFDLPKRWLERKEKLDLNT